MAVSRQVTLGIKNVKYALLTSGDSDTSTIPTYGTIKTLFQAAVFGYDPASSQSTAYYDDGPRFLFTTTGEISISLEGDDIYPENTAELLGKTYAAGMVQSMTDDEPPYVAIGGQITKSGGVSGYFWIPKAQLVQNAVTINTKGAEPSPQNVALSGRAVGLTYNNVWMMGARSDDANVAAATISGWFNAVVYATSANLNALGVTGVAEGTDDIDITFAKTGAGNFILDPATVIAANIIILDAAGAVAATTFSTPSTTPAATQVITAPASGTLAAGTYYVIVQGVKDSNGIEVTQFTNDVVIA